MVTPSIPRGKNKPAAQALGSDPSPDATPQIGKIHPFSK